MTAGAMDSLSRNAVVVTRTRLRSNESPVFLLAIAVVIAIPTWGIAQGGTVSGVPAAAREHNEVRDELMRSFQDESKRGAYLFYSQSYRAHRHLVVLHGSLFGEIQEAHADGCGLAIRSEIVDTYSGTVGDKTVSRTQSKYLASIRLQLTRELAADLRVVAARPVRQLPVGTNAVCSDSRQCMLTWITLRTNAPAIKLTEFTNDVSDYDGDVKDFDGLVRQLWLPVSSIDAGNDLVEKLKAFAQSCTD